ncbi:hypothetical protein B2D07_05185 [Desulfococcus multivorans]|nr:hypothetical protein B2D07_05185 [Desulfococcus multivorans]
MHPLHHYYAIQGDENVGDALHLIAKAASKGKMPCLLVIGKNRQARETVIGSLSSREIVFGIMGHFLKSAGKIGPILWEGRLETEMPTAASRRVADIMTPVSACIGGSQDIMEAVFLLNKHRATFLPVIRQQEVVGGIHLDDILNRFIQMVSL